MDNHLTSDEAMEFFAEFYGGAHHIPNYKVFEFGYGWMVKHDRGDLATFDYNDLTRLVLMAHDKCMRVSIMPLNKNTVQIAVWKRQREGSMSERHPTLEQAIESYRKSSTTTLSGDEGGNG